MKLKQQKGKKTHCLAWSASATRCQVGASVSGGVRVGGGRFKGHSDSLQITVDSSCSGRIDEVEDWWRKWMVGEGLEKVE